MNTSVKIPFNDLGRGTEIIRPEIDDAISRVVSSGWFVLGPEHDALEIELAEYLGIKNAINVGNGTDALELALAAVGVQEGSQVVTVANAGAYTTTATLLLGAEPIYCDVDPETLLMTPQTLELALSKLSEKPQAVVVTHLYGALAQMSGIAKVAARHGIPLVEDCAQSFGASEAGKFGGTFGDIATTSFYPTKNLGALGDGGAVFTNNSEYAEKVRRMRQYGWSSKYKINFSHGKNSRLDEIQAAILRVKLPHLNENNEKRKLIHSRYETVKAAGIKVLNHSSDSFIGHLAVFVSPTPQKVREQLAIEGIQTDVHYPIPDHKQQFPDFVPKVMPLEVTEWASESIFSVPLFPELSDKEVERICASLEAIS